MCPWIYREEPVFEIPRKNYHWVSDYDFLYAMLRQLEQRVVALESHKSPDASKEEKHES